MKIRTQIKAGGDIRLNHNGVKIRTGVKSGPDGVKLNHNGVKIRTGVKSGGRSLNHNAIRL